jgi:hypothetical protein
MVFWSGVRWFWQLASDRVLFGGFLCRRGIVAFFLGRLCERMNLVDARGCHWGLGAGVARSAVLTMRDGAERSCLNT